MPDNHDKIDILIATDCISEGQNLQDCDFLVNYDIHWNPVRIIQRFGRIDRIGSKNKCIQLVNFWPDLTLDEYLDLKSRVENRMKIAVMSSTATAEDNPIDNNDKFDIEYRKNQLKQLRDSTIDLEDMNEGISIMDLGLNEFRMDLVEYSKEHHDIDHAPYGMHAVVCGEHKGVIFVLKNVNDGVNIENKNHLHPYYLVYISDDGKILSNHLVPKTILDTMRSLCKGKNEPVLNLCREFNTETNGGKNMKHISELLEKAVSSIVTVADENDVDSFFGGGDVTFFSNSITGLDDFELIDFIVIK